MIRALKSGINPNKIVFSGVGKTRDEIEYAIKQKILLINSESLSEVLAIETAAKKLNKVVDIGLRLNPDTDAETLKQISTGKSENKFGVDKKTFVKIINLMKQSKFINIKCLSVHIGSQILNHRPYEKMLNVLDKLLRSLDYKFEFIDLGGGMGINYDNKTKKLNYTKYKKSIIKFKNNIKEDTFVKGDHEKLIEVFSNIIDNRIKYSEQNKNIDINLSKDEGKIIGNSYTVSIKDEGIGIPVDKIQRVTERFFRADAKKSMKVGGTGLGLAIVKHIVKQHRGDIEINSSPQNGTEMRVHLPLF